MHSFSLPYDRQVMPMQIENDRFEGVLTVPDKNKKQQESPEEIVRRALDNPIGTKTLPELAKGKQKIVVVTSDHTRAVPSSTTMPIILEQLRKGNPDADITILIATGLHRGMSKEEQVERFGKQIAEHEKIINHQAFEKDSCVYLGTLPSGSKCEINKLAVEADLLIAEGFIEPHFFAGFSGGRKSILPGIASAACVNINHSARQIADPKSTTGILAGNPIHEDMACAARMAHLAFILNVLLDTHKQIETAYAGDVEAAHAQGCRKLLEDNGVAALKADIVVTTNGGFPLDQNLYQCPKGLASALECVKKNGIVILVAACKEGLGGKHFEQMMQEDTPQERLDRIMKTAPEDTIPEQWCVQRFCAALLKYKIILVSSLPQQLVEKMGFLYADNIDKALETAYRLKGPTAKVTVIPDGVAVIIKR